MNVGIPQKRDSLQRAPPSQETGSDQLRVSGLGGKLSRKMGNFGHFEGFQSVTHIAHP